MGADGSAGVGSAPWRAAMAQVFVGELTSPVLDDVQTHHLSRVLRLRDGEVVCAADGRGSWRLCRWNGGALEPGEEAGSQPAPAAPLTVGFAPVKGERPEWVVQKLTELGVDAIAVVPAARSVVRWDGERLDRHLDRLRRTSVEAAAQCRRLWLPSVDAPAAADLADAVLADAGGRPPGHGDHTVLVGPEGGWTDEEREGRECVVLSQNILRTETAAVAAGVILTALRTGLVLRSLS